MQGRQIPFDDAARAERSAQSTSDPANSPQQIERDCTAMVLELWTALNLLDPIAELGLAIAHRIDLLAADGVVFPAELLEWSTQLLRLSDALPGEAEVAHA